MTLIGWLIVGIVTGILAKRVVPKMETSDWFFAALIAIVGAMMGGFAGEVSGVSNDIFVVKMIIALAGSFTTLFFFREYISSE